MTEKHRFSIGVDLGGTKIATGLCENGKILKKIIFPTKAKNGFESVVNVIVEAVERICKETEVQNIAGIGIGSAGQINSSSGEVIFSGNLGWHNEPLGSSVASATGKKVKVINDVRAATVAEQIYGNGKECRNFINIFLGTGIGSGFVLNGKLLDGATNSAGEIGHICLDPDGPVCGCGKQGCFEAYASGTAMENYVKDQISKGRKSIVNNLVEGIQENIHGPVIGEAARQGDALALEAIKRVGRYLGLVVANLHTMLNPEIVLLGGGMMALEDFFRDEMNEAIKQHVLPVAGENRQLVKPAKFTNDAVLLGGAALFA